MPGNVKRTSRQFGRGFARDRRDDRHRLPSKRSNRQWRYWNDAQWFGDQGPTPQCVGFAWSHFLSASPISQRLSPDGIYELAKFLDEWQGQSYDGTSVRAGAKVLHHLGFLDSYRWAADLASTVHAVLELGPVVVGTDWYEGMNAPSSSGELSPTGRNLGGHAYCITGVHVGRAVFRVKNSYGRAWGIGGRAWLPFAAFSELLAARGECCLGVEARP